MGGQYDMVRSAGSTRTYIKEPADINSLRKLANYQSAKRLAVAIRPDVLLLDFLVDVKVWLGLEKIARVDPSAQNSPRAVVVITISFVVVLLLACGAGRESRQLDRGTDKGFQSISYLSKRVLGGESAIQKTVPGCSSGVLSTKPARKEKSPYLSPPAGNFSFYSR